MTPFILLGMATRRAYIEHVSTIAHITAEELLRLNLPNKRTELIRGQLVVREPAGALHGSVAMRIGTHIYQFVESNHLGRVYATDTGFKIEAGPDTVRAPDVAYISTARLPKKELLGYPSWAPD